MVSTIRDIAEAAQVSCTTVSLVLNRRPGVGLETRKRVLEIARRLNYKNLPTATFPIEKSRTIRLLRIVKHGHIVDLSNNAFISEYIDGLEGEASANGWRLEVSSYDHFDAQQIMQSIQDGSIAGLVVCGTELNESDIASFLNAPIPIVFFDTVQANLAFDFVEMNNDSAVFSVVTYLKELGHRNIGLVTGTIENRNFKLREKSFMQALDYYHLPFKEQNIFAIDPLYEKGCEDMAVLIRTRRRLPTALFCVADFIAYSCMKTLKANGYSIPDDISIVGFDDMPSSYYLEPPLTSVIVPKRRIGQRAMELLLRRINDPQLPYEQVLIGSTLVVRDSARKIETA
jgi:DNA-binding LacI/PurR family transcriptional regulator